MSNDITFVPGMLVKSRSGINIGNPNSYSNRYPIMSVIGLHSSSENRGDILCLWVHEDKDLGISYPRTMFFKPHELRLEQDIMVAADYM